jgi:hypothetical protein
MRIATTALSAAFVGVAFSSVCAAQSKSDTPTTPSAPTTAKGTESVTAQATVLTGKVTSVDAKAGKLTVQTKDKEIKLTTDSASTKTALVKLKLGDTARIFERGGQIIAVSPIKPDSNAPK